jgi:hypothetical protein
MKYLLLFTLITVAVVFIMVELRRALRVYLRFRGKMLVSCPETHRPAAVRVAAAKAAWEAIVGNGELRLSECSRWRKRHSCGQKCLAQIQEAPKACLVWTIINRWYQGRNCVYCHKPFGEIRWHDHPPALLAKERRTVQWNEIRAEKLQEALGTHQPVCWTCHMAESFRREHPERVVDRPADALRMSLYH